MGSLTRSTCLFGIFFTLTALTFGQPVTVDLMWDSNDPSDNVAGYHVYRSGQSGSGYVRINQALVTATSYVDSTAPPGETCYYVCSAVNGDGLESGFSNEVPFAAPAGNSAPEARDDEAATLKNVPVVINVLGNDQDPDQDQLSVVEASQGQFGSVVLNDDHTVTYSPNSGFVGTDSFVYAISDGNGGGAEATVWVIVNEAEPPPNDPPSALNDLAETLEDESVVVFVLNNDTDPNGDPLTVIEAALGEHGWVSIVENGAAIQYFPDDNFSGTDSFVYVISDGKGGVDEAVVTIHVEPVNDTPNARDDEVVTTQGESVVIEVLSNDSDPDEGDELVVTESGQAEHGTVEVNQDNTITYTPASDFLGDDSFVYTVSDGAVGSDSATVFIQVIESNEPPSASDDGASTNEDESVLILVLDNDSDPDQDPLEIVETSQGEHGSVAIVEEGAALRYEPSKDFSGADSFVYTVSDGKGGVAEAVVTVEVSPVNDLPVANADEAFTQIGKPVSISVLSNDSDVDEDELSVIEVSQGTNGSVEIAQDYTITYTPNSEFSGEDSFNYTVSDGNEGTATATVSLLVSESNEAPAASDDTVSTSEDEPVTIQVLGNDNDPDNDPLIIIEVSQGDKGSVDIVEEGQAIRYSPVENFSGEDSFTYRISDEKGGSASANVTVTVTAVNDPPVANDDVVDGNKGASVAIEVLSNDFDPDEDSLTVEEVTQPMRGTVALEGNIATYTPQDASVEQDSFEYTVGDGQGGSDNAVVTVTFAKENRAPTAVDDSGSTNRNKSVTIDVVFNDIDPDGDSLTVSEVTQPEYGSVEISSKRTVRYRPSRNYKGNDHFEYTISDGKDSAKAKVNVKVLYSSSKNKKLVFPASVSIDASYLDDTYVGIGVLNPSYETDWISLSTQDSEGLETANVQLGEPLPPKGQNAFMAGEAIELGEDSLTLTAEGVYGALQGFFMVGSMDATRLDGVGAELPDSTRLYFPIVKQSETVTTAIYLVNKNPESEAEFSLELYDPNGAPIESASGRLAPGGSLMGTVAEIFGQDLQMDEGYVKVISSGTTIAGFELVATEKSLESLAGRPAYSAKTLLAPQFFVDESSGGTSVLRLLNIGNWRTRITVEAFDDQSNLLATREIEVEPQQMLVQDLRDLLEENPEEIVTGFLKLDISGLMGTSSSVVGSISYTGFHGRTSTTLPLYEDGHTEMIFPHVAQTADTSIYTGFSILNPNEETASVRIEAFNRKGRRTALKEFDLAPGTRAIDLLRSETFFGPEFEQLEGHVRIRSSSEVVTFAVFGDYLGNFMSTIEGQESLK